MRVIVVRIMVLWSVLTLCLAPSAASAAAQTGDPAMAAAPADGARLYKQHCLACHGTDLRGKVGPDLSRIGSHYTKQQLEAIIVKGQGGMPGFGKQMTPAEIGTLAGWLASHK